MLAEAAPLGSMSFQAEAEYDEEPIVREQTVPASGLARPLRVYEGGMAGLECGDLRLGDFMEEVKTELWQYNAMPFRRRFRVQSLLR